jgi:hypothetical protein
MGKTYDVWSDADTERLRELYQRGIPFCDIPQHFPDKSYNQVRTKVSTMKMLRPDGYKPHSQKKLVTASLMPEHLMWEEHPDARRRAIITKAARGARSALKAMGAR